MWAETPGAWTLYDCCLGLLTSLGTDLLPYLWGQCQMPLVSLAHQGSSLECLMICNIHIIRGCSLALGCFGCT